MTSRFGVLEVQDGQVWRFPRGLPAFEGLRRFVVLDGPGVAFRWLQALDDGDVAFLLADPAPFLPGYGLPGLPCDAGALELEDPADLTVALVLTVAPGGRVTANLRAPVLFNVAARIGLQVILPDPSLPIRFPLFEGRRGTGVPLSGSSASAEVHAACL